MPTKVKPLIILRIRTYFSVKVYTLWACYTQSHADRHASTTLFVTFCQQCTSSVYVGLQFCFIYIADFACMFSCNSIVKICHNKPYIREVFFFVFFLFVLMARTWTEKD